MRFALGTGVAGFEGGDRVTGVALSDGRVLPADVVVESVGSVANTEWLAGNGLDLSDGVLTDEHLRVRRVGDGAGGTEAAAAGLPYVVAVGDVARFPNARYDGVPRRVEHWSIPGDTAKHAARALATQLLSHTSDLTPFAPSPPSGATSTTSGSSPSARPSSGTTTSGCSTARRTATCWSATTATGASSA